VYFMCALMAVRAGRQRCYCLKRSTHWYCCECGENQSYYGNKTCDWCLVALSDENTRYV
jgi:hypothetical protein